VASVRCAETGYSRTLPGMDTAQQVVRIEFQLPVGRAAELRELSERTGVRQSDVIRYALFRLMQDPRGFVGPPAGALEVLARNECNGGGS
jgi:hypothetical protein